MGDDRFVPCCVIKVQNKLKYNFCGSVYLLQLANVTGINTKWFQNFQRFELLWRVIFPTRVKNWFDLTGVSNNRVFEKSGIKLQC